jgi:hypothetical protein
VFKSASETESFTAAKQNVPKCLETSIPTPTLEHEKEAPLAGTHAAAVAGGCTGDCGWVD